MVKALQRAEQVAAYGAGRVEVDAVPVNRLPVLARTGLGSTATALARLREPKRTATLLAVVRHLEAPAIDDALDLFALLMATRLLSPARGQQDMTARKRSSSGNGEPVMTWSVSPAMLGEWRPVSSSR
jgi:hypothetical protein